MRKFNDRFELDNYEDDEPIHIGYALNIEDWENQSDSEVLFIPELIFTRAKAIAGAYQLHILPTVDIYETTLLNQPQSITLHEEIVFIRNIIKDTLLEQSLTKLEAVLQTVIRSQNKLNTVIDGI